MPRKTRIIESVGGRHLCVFSIFYCVEVFLALVENKPGVKSVFYHQNLPLL